LIIEGLKANIFLLKKSLFWAYFVPASTSPQESQPVQFVFFF
jgi:hypothetical protein